MGARIDRISGEVVRTVKEFGLACNPLGDTRLKDLLAVAARCEDLPGDVVELGVFQGVTAKALALFFPNKLVHLFDTFEGISEDLIGREDKPALIGRFTNSSGVEDVTKFLGDVDNVVFHAGPIEDTLPQSGITKVSMVHFDCDLYGCYKAGLEHLWPMLAPGGCTVFHDYGWASCPGATKAVNEFFKSRSRLKKLPCGYVAEKQGDRQ